MFTACIDIGGTFTDLVLHDAEGGLEIVKAPTTPGRFDQGFMDALGLAAEGRGVTLEALLGEIGLIVHGTTVSTNALVEGKTAPVGLLCTRGHPDVLTIRASPRKRTFNLKLDYPDPFVPRSRTCEIGGRIDAQGHELAPIPREYRRTIATAINAALFRTIAADTTALRDALTSPGYRNQLLIGNCIGGMMPPEHIIARPIHSVMSGPTLAPVAAAHLTAAAHVIVVDMGGTTFDVSGLRDRELVVSTEAMIGWDMLGIAKIDVRSVGAGGGSIAWIDPGGLLRVGPHSAGARPGPAGYGRGGIEATVTDANVVLGLIDPDDLLGGRIRLDRGLAEQTVGQIAARLGNGLVEAAHATDTTSNHTMIAAIEDITINEGIDPRESIMVSGGGATACHIGEMARLLAIRGYMVPRLAAGFSALGGLMSDVRWEESATLHAIRTDFPAAAVTTLPERLVGRGRAFLERAGFPPQRQRFSFAFMGRYLYQSWDIEVPFEPTPAGGVDLAALVARFHATHERIDTIKDEADVVELTTWKVRAIGDAGGAARRGRPLPAQAGPVQAKGHGRALVGEAAAIAEIAVVDWPGLGAGAVVDGPALIEAPTTTFLLPQGQSARVDGYGNLLVGATG